MLRAHARTASRSFFLGLLVATFVACGGGSGSSTGEPGDDTGTDNGDGSNGDGTSNDGEPGFDTGSGTDDADASSLDGDESSLDGGESSVDTGGGSEDADASSLDGDESSLDGGESSVDTGGTSDDTGTTSTDTGVDTGPADTGPPDPCTGSLGCAIDTDNDTIPDTVEGRCAAAGPTDTDGDGTPDYLDTESDGDTILDKTEWAAGGCDPNVALNDADGDGTPNFRDLDSDGNGLDDKTEFCPAATILAKAGKGACDTVKGEDFDGDGYADFLDFDNDHDSPDPDLTLGLEDKFELTNNAGAYVGLVDTDSDGIPDVYDVDSDNDFMFDLAENLGDPDKDGVPNFRDADSDADKVPDACEARANAAPTGADLPKAIKDTDGDGKPDYIDTDSDADLLTDGSEDKNFNCKLDTCETSRILADTDSDGVNDFIESTLDSPASCSATYGGWAQDPGTNPNKQGKFYFIEPYSTDGSAAPTPTSAPLGLQTSLQKGDLAFVVDTTFSMNGEFTGLQNSLPTIISSLKAKLPDLGIGVAGHDDVPTIKYTKCGAAPTYACPTGYTCYSYTGIGNWCTPNATDFASGSCDDTAAVFGTLPAKADDPYYQLTAVTTDATAATTAVKGLRESDGEDLPEDQVLAMYYALTGNTFSWPALNGCPAGSRPTVAATSTNFGAIGFRAGALPMLMEISDAEFHNGAHTATSMPGSAPSWCIYGPGATTCTTGAYTQTETYPFTEVNESQLITAMKTAGARFIGGAADDSRAARNPTTGVTYVSGPSAGVGGTSAARNAAWDFGAYGDMAAIADATTSYVPPSAFTHGATCAAGQCCTGFNGAGVAPDGPGGTCRLVFNVNHDGTGLGNQVVDGVVALLNAITFDVHVQASPTTGEAYDAVDNFMTSIQPSPSGGTDPSIGTCITFANALADRYHTPKALAGAGDIQETILGVAPGPLYCFNVIPKANVTVPATTSAQIFHASLQVIAENGTGTIPLGSARQVLFVVPPIVN